MNNYINSKNNKKLKIVWLCNFVNQEMNSYFNTSLNELAPWINELIKIFEKQNEIELYIVAPNLFNNKNISFEKKGIYYHFFQYQINNTYKLPRKLYNFAKSKCSIYLNISLKYIKEIIKEIKPDLIHLHGVEMPRYSIGVIPFLNKVPILVTIAGLISMSTSEKGKWIHKQIKLEKKLLKMAPNFAVRTRYSLEYIKKFNPKAVFFKHYYPYKVPEYSKIIDLLEKSEFDFVFFSRVCKDKGIEDLLYAMKKVVKKYPASKLLVIGKPSSPSYLNKLKDDCISLRIHNNVVFTGFLKSQTEVHKKAINARICVHPSYHDNLPGPIIESMYMGLAIITYNVGGIDILNDKRESVVLVEKGNVEMLSVEMVKLLYDHKRLQNFVENARQTVKKFYNNNKIYSDIINIYHRILKKSNSNIFFY